MIRVEKWKELFTRTEVEEIVVDILTEIQSEIEELPMYYDPLDISDLIKQKINALKENTDGNDK